MQLLKYRKNENFQLVDLGSSAKGCDIGNQKICSSERKSTILIDNLIILRIFQYFDEVCCITNKVIGDIAT